MNARLKSSAKSILCAAVAVAALAPMGTAHAQLGNRPVGTMLGVPFSQYVPFLAANAQRQRNVNALHLSNFVAGSLNTAVMTVGVNQNNNTQPADTVFIPAPNAGTVDQATTMPQAQAIRQINSNDVIADQTVVGSGNNAALQVDVNQANTGTYTPVLTRWYQAPGYTAEPTKALNASLGVNINNAHLQNSAIGSNNTAVMTVGVNQGNTSGYKIAAPMDKQEEFAESLGVGAPPINVNVNVNTIVANQQVIGHGNTAVATVNVNQQNL